LINESKSKSEREREKETGLKKKVERYGKRREKIEKDRKTDRERQR
jgi:hypothetical protein